jgi:2-polyprenyl-3-methyl-5-hydroxy-6-metoxy-1,4-benzoquinol methylase
MGLRDINEVRQYWDRRPCNIRHSTQPMGTRAYFDEVEARKYFVEPHIPCFADFERWRGKRVLEIGCGIGTDTVNFARHGADVTAVDLSAKSIDIARQRVQVYGLGDRVQFCNGNAERLSNFVPVKPYDLVYSFGVIHHTPNPGNVLDQMHHYMHHGARHDTTVKIMVYHRRSWKVLKILLDGWGQFWKLPELIATNSEAQTGCPGETVAPDLHVHSGRGREVAQVTDMFVDHIFPYRIPEYVQYQYVREPWFGWMPDSWFRAMERRLGWHLCITAVES